MSSPTIPRSRFMPLMALLSASGLIAALTSQHIFGFLPCSWCIAQRTGYLAILLLTVVASTLDLAGWRRSARLPAVLATVAAAATLATAIYHHFVAAPAGACGMSLPDKVILTYGLDELAPWFFQVLASCDEANLPMLGIPYSLWSAALAMLLTILGCAAIILGGHAARRSDELR